MPKIVFSKIAFPKLSDTLWIVPDCMLTRWFYQGWPSVYFLKKTKKGSILYDRRQLKRGKYALPPIEVEPIPLKKNPPLQKLEANLFILKQESLYHFQGDCVDNLQNKDYLQALQRGEEEKRPFWNSKWIYLWI